VVDYKSENIPRVVEPFLVFLGKSEGFNEKQQEFVKTYSLAIL